MTRPPRVTSGDLAQMWEEQEKPSEFPVPTIDLRRLALLKATQRDRDYSFVAEIARKLPTPNEQLLWSRSPHDIIQIAQENSGLAEQLTAQRPLLNFIKQGYDVLEAELDAKRRKLKRADKIRLATYSEASLNWIAQWPQIKREISGLPLRQAHQVILDRAQVLPQQTL